MSTVDQVAAEDEVFEYEAEAELFSVRNRNPEVNLPNTSVLIGPRRPSALPSKICRRSSCCVPSSGR
jgi:hypothetical protein